MAKRLPRSRIEAQSIEAIFSTFERIDPDPNGELDYTNNFTLLVAVVLSAQATDIGVNRATKTLFKLANSPEKMVGLGLDQITTHIKSIGLFRNKAKNVLALSNQLIERFHSEVPNTRDALESLPGVGRKTANVVLNIAFGQATIAVDTHLFRVANRTGMAPGKTPLEVEQGLLKRVPDRFLLHAHHWLILHGRYVCKARNPACPDCAIKSFCSYKNKSG